MTRIFQTLSAAAITFVFALGPSFAEDLMFPANQFGQADLRPKQSLGNNSAFIQSQQNAAFEPISDFNETDIYRRHARPVGRLSMLVRDEDGKEGVATCTATLIAPDRLLTNYHCIPGFGGQVLKSVVHFDYLRQDQDPVDSYAVDINPLDADPNLDFALLRVEGSPGNRYGYVQLEPVRVQPNASLLIFHHPAGLPLRLTRFRCKAYSGQAYSGNKFRHRCDTLGGSSGSLIFDNSYRVVALHHSGGLTGDSASSFNAGTDIHAILERLGGGASAAAPVAPSAPSAPAPRTEPAQPAQRTALARVPSNVSENKMNVRAGPGLGHGVVGAIPGGANDVTVFTDTCRKSDDGRTRKPWCRIEWRGVSGWVSSGGLRW